jgi:DNA mismatch repair ATPase MutS
MPRPMKGMDTEIDEILERMDQIKSQIKSLLDQTRAKFDCNKITYAHNRKYRYQFEVPHEHSQPMEDDDNYFVTVRLKHAKRFLCSELSNLTT